MSEARRQAAPATFGPQAVPVRFGLRAHAFVLLIVMLVAIASFAASGTPAHAADVEDYRERVVEARKVVEAYLATDAEEGAGEVAVAVLTALPSVERVTVGETDVFVDNSILRTMVARIDVSRDPRRRRAIAEDMIAHLNSIERSLPDDGDPVPADPEALASLLEEGRLAARSPARELLGDLIDRLGKAVERWQVALGASGAASRLLSFAVSAFVVSLALLLVFAIIRVAMRLHTATTRIREKTGRVEAPPVVPAEDDLPADVLGLAESLAAEGRFAEAVRVLFGGAARALAEAGRLTRTRTRTNWELVAEVRAASPDVAQALASLSTVFDRAVYGHADPGPEGYAGAREDFESVSAVVSDGGEVA